MRKFDILVVDIQDVGLRFYTYYASMCRLMDACAEYNRKVLILDRPNPNGHYVGRPDTDMKYIRLYLEKTYGLTSEKKIADAADLAADANRYHPSGTT